MMFSQLGHFDTDVILGYGFVIFTKQLYGILLSGDWPVCQPPDFYPSMFTCLSQLQMYCATEKARYTKPFEQIGRT